MCIYSVCVCAHMCEFNCSFTYNGDLFIPETVSCQIKSPEPDAGYLPPNLLVRGALEAS